MEHTTWIHVFDAALHGLALMPKGEGTGSDEQCNGAQDPLQPVGNAVLKAGIQQEEQREIDACAKGNANQEQDKGQHGLSLCFLGGKFGPDGLPIGVKLLASDSLVTLGFDQDGQGRRAWAITQRYVLEVSPARAASQSKAGTLTRWHVTKVCVEFHGGITPSCITRVNTIWYTPYGKPSPWTI